MEGSIIQRIKEAESAPREVLVLGRWPGWLMLLRWLLMFALAAGVIFAGLQIRNRLMATAEKPQSRPAVERSFPVDTVIAKRATVQPLISAYGEVAAGRSVDLRALVGGVVLSVSPNLIEGGAVKEGETLLTVDAFAYESALTRARADKIESEARLAETAARITSEKQALARAQEQLELAERDSQRIAQLRRSGSASNAQVDAADLRLSNAAQAVDQRRNAVLVLEAQQRREAAPVERLDSAIRSAERDIANAVLVAPFPGIISNAGAEVGKLLTPNDRVATLVSLAEPEVRFTLGDAQFGRLSSDGAPLEGRKITAVWRSGDAEQSREGVISRVAPLANARDGGFDVYAKLGVADGSGGVWRPGAFVEVRLADAPVKDAISLPQSALFPGDVVYVLGSDSRLVEKKVTRLGFDGTAVLVGGDIADGAEIVSTRLSEAGPGVLVTPRSKLDAPPPPAAGKPAAPATTGSTGP